MKVSRIGEATQWKGFDEGPDTFDIMPICNGADNGMLDGKYPISPGDWVIEFADERIVCKESDFAGQYQEIK